jgi:hypothetical protein
MWIVQNICSSHQSTVEGAPGPFAVLTLEPRDAAHPEPLLWVTSDASVVACASCSARPFTVLCAEKFGLRSSPSIPKRCILQLSDFSVLESLEASSTLEELELQLDHYVVKRENRRHCQVEWLREPASGEVSFCEVADFDHAFRGLKKRLQSCGLCHETVLKVDLCVFPLLFWHVCELGVVAQEDALVVAARLLSHLAKKAGREQPLPPFEAMPDSVKKATAKLFMETQERLEKRKEKVSRLRCEMMAELKECDRILGLRNDLEIFDRNAYLEWGDSRCRPCCGFHFMKTRGCATCERAFLKGRELNALKMDPPDWKALALRKNELRMELYFMLFED